MTFLQKFFALMKPAHMVLFLHILILIPIIQFLLLKKKIPALLKFLDRNTNKIRPLDEKDGEFTERAWSYANAILIRCLRFKKPCLTRSLILFYLFRKKGLGVRIHFGVKKNMSPFEGHSWLSINGTFFLDHTDPELLHADMYSYPSEI